MLACRIVQLAPGDPAGDGDGVAHGLRVAGSGGCSWEAAAPAPRAAGDRTRDRRACASRAARPSSTRRCGCAERYHVRPVRRARDLHGAVRGLHLHRAFDDRSAGGQLPEQRRRAAPRHRGDQTPYAVVFSRSSPAGAPPSRTSTSTSASRGMPASNAEQSTIADASGSRPEQPPVEPFVGPEQRRARRRWSGRHDRERERQIAVIDDRAQDPRRPGHQARPCQEHSDAHFAHGPTLTAQPAARDPGTGIPRVPDEHRLGVQLDAEALAHAGRRSRARARSARPWSRRRG